MTCRVSRPGRAFNLTSRAPVCCRTGVSFRARITREAPRQNRSWRVWWTFSTRRAPTLPQVWDAPCKPPTFGLPRLDRETQTSQTVFWHPLNLALRDRRNRSAFHCQNPAVLPPRIPTLSQRRSQPPRHLQNHAPFPPQQPPPQHLQNPPLFHRQNPAVFPPRVQTLSHRG